MAETQEKILHVDGMTCSGCELKIERKLQKTPGVSAVKADYAAGTVTVSYDKDAIKIDEIASLIEKLDYKVIQTPLQLKKAPETVKFAGVLLILVALYWIINRFGGISLFNAFPEAEKSMSYGMLFVVGLLTSVHCIAMCGGINLSQSVRAAQTGAGGQTEAGSASVLLPTFLYNLGRVISYTLIGGIVGAIGSVVSFSGTAKGIVQLGAGIFMVIMGLNMLGIFPWLRKLNPRMPKIFARKIGAQKRNSNSPLYVGLLNGLMPCGPLQAMQLYALSTGNFFAGALSMFLFSLGTVPLMFGFGALSSLLNHKFTGRMMRVSAALVIILGVSMFSNGVSLSGISVVPSDPSPVSGDSVAQIQHDVQVVTSKVLPGQYKPITVQKGIPVHWTLQADEKDINGCNNRIIIPKYQLEKKLLPGDNIIEFTPDESGTIAFSCWMGMIRSRIDVVDDLSSLAATVNPAGTANATDLQKMLAIATLDQGTQSVSIQMDEVGFTPSVIVVQRGLETVWTIKAQAITPDNNRIVLPVYDAEIALENGENTVRLVPTEDFEFHTPDEAFFGYVKVVDDLSNIDADAILDEIYRLIPTQSLASVNL